MKKLSAVLLSSALIALTLAPVAEAKFRGFGGGFRSSSSFSRTYTAKPTYRPAPSYKSTKTVNNTTIVQQRSGGGMFSSIVGTVVGMSVYNWLFGEDEQQQPAPTGY